MATFSSPEAWVRAAEAMERDLKREALAITRKMAEQGEKIAVEEASKDLGGNSSFSGWKGGARDLANLQIKPKRSPGSAAHFLFPTRKSGGPWKVAEQGRNIGEVRRGGIALAQGPGVNKKTGLTSYTKTGKVRVTRSRKRGGWNGYTPAFRTASRAAARFSGRQVTDIAEDETRKVIGQRFDVT